MLQIFANNTELNLTEDIFINLIIENPFVTEGRVPVPYSFSFELEPTQLNLQMFNYPQRLAAFSRNGDIQRSVDCVIKFQGLKIAIGKLILTKFENTLTVNFSGLDFNDQLKTNLSETNFGRHQFQGDYGTVDYNKSTNYAFNYKNWASSSAFNANGPYVIAPVAKKVLEEYRWTIPTRGSVSFNTRVPASTNVAYKLRDRESILREWYYNCFNPPSKNFFFPGGASSGAHADVLPQFRIYYLLECILGNSLTNNPFRENIDLINVVLPSYQLKYVGNTGFNVPRVSSWASAPLVSNRSGHLPNGVPELKFADFMPDVAANDFVKEILGLFCFSIYFRSGQFQIRSNTDILKSAVKSDWSSKLSGALSVQFSKGQFYDYGYNDEVLIYEGPTTSFTTVSTIQEMINRSYTLSPEFNDYSESFYVSSTRQYFEKYVYKDSFRMVVGNSGRDPIYGDETEIISSYTFLGYNLSKSVLESDKSKFDAKSNIKLTYLAPVPCLDNLIPSKTNKQMLVLPVHESTTTDPYSRESSLELMMYLGPKAVVSDGSASNNQYPFLSSTGSDNVSFFWEGQNGLLEKFHKDFKSWIEKDKVRLSGKILLSSIDLHNLDVTEKININGRNFFIEKISLSITYNQLLLADVDFIEV